MYVKCGLLTLAALLLTAFPAGAATRYDDGPCRAGSTGWTNDACAARQWGLARIAAQQAWRVTRGAGVRVAVVDTGADFRHPELRPRLLAFRGSDLTKNTAYRCPYEPRGGGRKSRAVAVDDNGHGTHVAGIIAASAGNRAGVAGVAPLAKVVPVKVLDKNGTGTDAAVARGICFAVPRARVINLSLGEDPIAQLLIDGSGRLTAQAIDYAYKRGRVVVVAGGNDSFPLCGFHTVRGQALCVGAVDHNDLKATYSNFGDSAAVMAPGGGGRGLQCRSDEDVWSTIWPGSPDDCSHTGYQPLAGTSMATPHVAGAAALVVARFGSARPSFVYRRLRATADDLGLPGADPLYGVGRINAGRAVVR